MCVSVGFCLGSLTKTPPFLARGLLQGKQLLDVQPLSIGVWQGSLVEGVRMLFPAVPSPRPLKRSFGELLVAREGKKSAVQGI